MRITSLASPPITGRRDVLLDNIARRQGNGHRKDSVSGQWLMIRAGGCRPRNLADLETRPHPLVFAPSQLDFDTLRRPGDGSPPSVVYRARKFVRRHRVGVAIAGSVTVALLAGLALAIGLLDESYFIYGDEADLQYRLKKAGWKVYFLPNSSIIHFGGRSMDRWKRRKMVYRGNMMFYKKNYGFLSTFLLRLLFFVMSLLKLLVWCVGFFVPSRNEQAKKELRSNFDVMARCA